MSDFFCLICGAGNAQYLGSDKDGVSAVCADCGPYKIDRQVLKIMKQGRKLNAGMMKKWIAKQYDPHTNPVPLITPHSAVWPG